MRNIDYFAEGERGSQEKFQRMRDKYLVGVARLLDRIGLTPNLLSAVGLIALLPFAFVVIAFPDPTMVGLASLLLFVHLFLDAMDGPLARLQGTGGNAGALVDMLCDHGAMVLVVVTLIQSRLANGALGCLYVFFYTLSIVCIISLNIVGQPFRMVLRSKYFIFLLVPIYGVLHANFFNIALAVFTASDVALLAIGLPRLYRYLKEEDNAGD